MTLSWNRTFTRREEGQSCSPGEGVQTVLYTEVERLAAGVSTKLHHSDLVGVGSECLAERDLMGSRSRSTVDP